MKNHTFIRSVLGMALIFTTVTACGDDGKDDGESTGTTPPAGTETTMVDPSTEPTTTPDETSIDPDTTNGPTVDPDTTSPTSTTEPPDTTTGDPGFNFPTNGFDEYTQIDRHAAVEAGTAGIRASGGLGLNGEDIAIRDAYNASNPTEDAAMMWLGEIADSIMFFHDNIDDDITGLGLTPATFDQTVAQAGPVILPDTIKYDATKPTGYPNGRALTDQVVDITLAAVLLDLSVHPLDLFAQLPLNPPENDVPFGAEFPFLAPPHAP